MIASVMPKISATVAQRTTTGAAAAAPIDLATAENWLVREEILGIYREALARDLGKEVNRLFVSLA